GGVAAINDRYRGDRVAVALDLLARLQLDDAELERRAPVYDPHCTHQLLEAPGAVNGERLAALAQRERLQHARQPEPVIGVEMGDEHRVEVDEPDGAQQLALRPFTAVKQQPIAPAPYEQAGQPPPRARNRARGSEEDQRQVHAATVAARRPPRHPGAAAKSR